MRPMKITFGTHNGELLEKLLVEEGQYITWLLDEVETPATPAGRLRAQAIERIERFDAKPFVERCWMEGCSRLAVRSSFLAPNFEPMFWCPTCDPYSSGAPPGRLTIVKRYRQVLRLVQSHGDRKGDHRLALRHFCTAKGLSRPWTERRLIELFR